MPPHRRSRVSIPAYDRSLSGCRVRRSSRKDRALQESRRPRVNYNRRVNRRSLSPSKGAGIITTAPVPPQGLVGFGADHGSWRSVPNAPQHHSTQNLRCKALPRPLRQAQQPPGNRLSHRLGAERGRPSHVEPRTWHLTPGTLNGTPPEWSVREVSVRNPILFSPAMLAQCRRRNYNRVNCFS